MDQLRQLVGLGQREGLMASACFHWMSVTCWLAAGVWLGFSAAVQAQSPDRVDGLVLWVAADTITNAKDGERVHVWQDASGHQHHLASLRARYGNLEDRSPRYLARAVNGKPALQFDSTATTGYTGYGSTVGVMLFTFDGQAGDLVCKSLAKHLATQPATIFLVVRDLDPDNHDGATFSFASGLQMQGNSCLSAQRPELRFPIFFRFRKVLDWHLKTILLDGERSLVRADGQMIGRGSITQPRELGDLVLGGKYFQGAYRRIDLAEVLIYNRALAGHEESAVGGGLMRKYGLRGTYSAR